MIAALTLLLGLPMLTATATSLVIIVINSAAAFTAHLGTDKITALFDPTAYQGASQALIDRLLASLDKG